MQITQIILQGLYLMLPAYFANMTPVLVKKINLLNYPLDFNLRIKNKTILGTHKTWRGLIFGTTAGIIISFIQYQLQTNSYFTAITILDYSNWLSIGFLLGFGALFGDAFKSLIKRRFKIKPGKPFFPWDQLDFLIGALLFISFIHVPDINIIIAILLISPILTIICNHIAFYTKIRGEKW
jgi:CDP-2,3-bis-(O-geranylgeranyl)-sn-glycerol synthase